MKNITTLLIASVLIGALGMACDESTPPKQSKPQEVNFYYFNNKKIQLKVRKDLVIVKTASNIEATVLSELDVFSEDRPTTLMDFWIVASIDPEKTTIEDVRKLPGVLGAAYGMENDNGFPCWPMDQITVRPVEGRAIEKIIDKTGLAEYVKTTEPLNMNSDFYSITLNLNPEYILWASNELYETGLCIISEPNFLGGSGPTH